ncbi:cyclin-P3-1 [Punica granatum]|uniref:Cyclin-P3-1 n=1 Tax=Punica granatum TaxID=22663 RepID=A0A6P8EAE8_PUNGR|nr:cyclin-P3-1 [Punica granatum]
MGTLASDVDDLTSDIHLSLGLMDLGKKVIGSPQVITLLSSFLEISVQKNERLLETAQIKNTFTVFHGMRAPTLSIRHYIDRVFKYFGCSPSCFVIAQVYVDRFLKGTDGHLTSLNVHRLLITSIMVAAKFIDDAFFNNAYYAKVGGVSTFELNRLEMKFLFGINFRLYVSVDTFRSYCLQLEKGASSEGLPIERPIRACRVKQNWSATASDESTCASTVAR